jgi:hypothetical protein
MISFISGQKVLKFLMGCRDNFAFSVDIGFFSSAFTFVMLPPTVSSNWQLHKGARIGVPFPLQEE